MEKAKIAVFVSGGGTNLQALIDAQGKIITSGEIAVVISSKPGVFALERAAKANIPTAVVERKACKTQNDFEQGLISILDQFKVDFIILAGFMSILSESFTKKYSDRIINVHPSLIPSFCGKGFYGIRVHEAALEYGVKVTGATVHFVNEIPDGGKIILQKAVEIKEGDTPEILQKRVMEEAEWKLLPMAAEIVAAKIVKGE